MTDLNWEPQIPEVFSPLFTEEKRYYLLHGGRGSGKSENAGRFFLMEGLRSKHLILCTRETQESIAHSVHRTLKDIIIEEELPYHYNKTSIWCDNGTEFIFKGLRDNTSQSIKSIKGITLCWVEEAQKITKNSLDILTPTIREEGSKIIFTYNRLEISIVSLF